MIAIIGGSGLTALANLKISHRQVVRTPYGEPSGPLTFGHICGHEVVFLARHGNGHTIAPHEINYRANLWALHSLAVSRVIAVASVGGIRADLRPGVLVVPDQIIDYTWGRRSTYFEGSGKPVTHIDFTEPYDGETRLKLVAAGAAAGVPLQDGGTYACTQGPRLETAAEVRRIAGDGGDMIGMTGMPEAALARELAVPYATLAVVVNAGAGIGQSEHHIDLLDAHAVLERGITDVLKVVEALVMAEMS